MPMKIGIHAFLSTTPAKAWMPTCVGMTGLLREWVNGQSIPI
jgi:hypothetical protein